MKKTELQDLLGEIARIASRGANGKSSGDGDYGRYGDRDSNRDESGTRGVGGRELLRRKSSQDALLASKESVHRFGRSTVCSTDERGHVTPGNRSPLEIVLDASEGFIPLWTNGVTLRWKFNETSLEQYLHPELLKDYVRELMSEAILAWGYAAPVGFKERDDAWDFEIVVRAQDDCDANGCTLASAFFPDGGRHKLVIYPKMFDQIHQEQVDTLVHEIGHVFGLRHFFANVSETAWPSEIFGEHRAFSIMNYGWKSVLTEDDRSDLSRLYESVWSGELAIVNGTPIHLVKPYHAAGEVVSPGCESRAAARNA